MHKNESWDICHCAGMTIQYQILITMAKRNLNNDVFVISVLKHIFLGLLFVKWITIIIWV